MGKIEFVKDQMLWCEMKSWLTKKWKMGEKKGYNPWYIDQMGL